MRVFIGPNEVAGQYRNLAIALRGIGVDCDYYIFNNDNLRYGGDLGGSRLPAAIRRINSYRKEATRPVRLLLSGLIEFVAFVFLLRCIARYDVFLFGFGVSLLRWNLDLPLLKIFGKRVVANMSHGSDMTPPYLDGALMDSDMRMPEPSALLVRSTMMKRRIRKFEKYGDLIIGSPMSSSYYSSKRFINLFHMGRVSQGFRYIDSIEATDNAVLRSEEHPRKMRIVHAPSHAPGKGTAIIRNVIKELGGQGYEIDFVEIAGKSNDAVIQELKSCDLVVDQVYADLPMSGLAAEAACFGKPTLISGYDLVRLRHIMPRECFPPTIICEPEYITATLKDLLDHPKKIYYAGKAVRNFVFDQWSQGNVASRYLRLLSGCAIPDDWWHDPKSALFLHGYGLSDSASRLIIRQMIAEYGVGGLGLEHRPDLAAELLKYSKSSD